MERLDADDSDDGVNADAEAAAPDPRSRSTGRCCPPACATPTSTRSPASSARPCSSTTRRTSGSGVATTWTQFGAENVAYAGKAFLCTAMARLVDEEGLHLDVATGGELHVALTAGFPPTGS